MEFAETPTFMRRVHKLLGVERYRLLQAVLDEAPEGGSMMQGTSGARKIRWAQEGRGKSGSVRVIYYYDAKLSRCYMLMIFGKNEQDNLSDEQKSAVRRFIKEKLR
ncbi:MAG TPA: type II toxin-antitoxin system RelE/ParE family toxin [Rhodothermales bacterium]|nr:type II toxin-antitoxin system RelE/ParE family toxin [Rhodothermales bacterium]